MKTIVFTEYGAPDVLRLEEVAKPTPEPNQVLVKIVAAAANPLDWHIMRGEPFIARLDSGLQKPRNTKLGADIAGRVEAVGSKVSEFKIGDEVFGDLSGNGLGGFAEYACAPESALAHKPANVSFEAGAASGVAAITALQGLGDKGRVQAGERVLINGASGGIGTAAVQIAKAYGAEVTGVCSTRNLEMVCSIGADHVIDYTREDFTNNGRQYDLIFDAIGNRSVGDYGRALKPTGRCVIAGFTTLRRLFEHMVIGGLASRGSKKIGLMGSAVTNKGDLLALKELLEAGKLIPVIDRRYPLSETAEALHYLEQGHARGKVIVTVADGE